MPNLIENAEALINSVLAAWFSIDIEYRRGVTTETPISVTTGGQQFALINEYGVFGNEQANDFIVLATELDANFGGEPQRGDVIAWTIDGTVHLFECSGPGDEKHFVAHGPNRERWRIHTKYIGTE